MKSERCSVNYSRYTLSEIASMKTFTLYATLLVGAMSSAQAVTYNISPTHSYVQAYEPAWQRVADSEGFLIIDPADDLPPILLQPSFHWELHWVTRSFSLSGSFELLREAHAWQEGRGRLYLGQTNLFTDAPDYTQFGLPSFFAVWGDLITYDSGPCFDYNFGDLPGWTSYCTGWTNGPTRTDQGILDGGTLSVHGISPGLFPLLFTAWAPDSPEPPTTFDSSGVRGIYEYQLVAVAAVPEPASLALLGIGLAGLCLAQRRR